MKLNLTLTLLFTFFTLFANADNANLAVSNLPDITPGRENFLQMSVDMKVLKYLPNEKQLELFCKQQNGRLTNEWVCPATKVIRTDGPFCVLSDKIGRTQVTNGCTGTHGVAPEFFKACVMHDFCYHNHAVMNGGTKEACDYKFLHDMYAICDSYIGDSAVLAVTCYAFAQKAFYGAVQFFGKNSWNCDAGNVEYPQSINGL